MSGHRRTVHMSSFGLLPVEDLRSVEINYDKTTEHDVRYDN